MNIGDVFLALRADGGRFLVETKAEAEKAGDAAGKTLGERISSGASKAIRAGLVLVSGAAAIATAGMHELEDATADYRTETGATEEQAREAGKAILEMSSRNVQPIREIGKVLGLVHTDLGLVGEEADATAERFLHFARVTKRDAAAEVKSFDDILDAWELTAADIPGLMDKLVASHQRYGGSIEQNEAALAAMAPQLKALNLTVDDGIGLLNLFASSGLDAAAGQKALNSAITNLPKGESLTEFIARLSTIEDDGLRAQAAMEVFGAKAGAGLANAIRPGIGSLDKFKVSAEDAAGAAQAAAEAADSSFGTRIQLVLKGFAAKMIEAGESFGPLLTGLAGVSTLLTSVFGPEILRKLGPRVVATFKAIASAGADAFSDVWTGAGGTVVGNTIASRIENIFDPEKNTVLGGVMRKAAAKAAAVWGIGFAAGTAITAALAQLLGALGASPELTAAITASGATLGAIFQAAFVAGIAALAFVGSGQIVNALGLHDIDLSKPYYSKGVQAGQGFVEGVRATGTEAVDAAAQLVEDAVHRAGERMDGMLAPARTELSLTGGSVEDYQSRQKAALDKAYADVQLFAANALATLQGFRSAIEGGYQASLSAAEDAEKTRLELVIQEGALAELDKDYTENHATWTAAQIADYQLRRLGITTEMQQLQYHLSLIGDETARVAAEKARLGAIANALLTEKNPEVIQGYHDEQQSIMKDLGRIASEGGPAASEAADTIAVALGALGMLPADARGWGWQLGSEYADGLRATYGDLQDAADGAARILSDNIRIASPAKKGPLSLGGGPEGWGERLTEQWAHGIVSGVNLVRAAVGRLAGAADLSTLVPGTAPMLELHAPDVRGTGLSRAMQVADAHASYGLEQAQAGPGGDTYHISVPVQGILPVETVEDVIRPLRQLAQTGQLARRPRLSYG